MPVSYTIFPNRDLVVVHYEGFVGLDETMVSIDTYARDPDFRPDQKFLFDLSRVTGHETDFLRFFQMQGQLVEVYGQTGHDQLFGLYAPTGPAKAMANLGYQSWESVPAIVMLIHHDEAEVLRFLGQPETRIADLFASIEAER
ncbi:hypothetical protein [Sinisalibacter aestuarii]|uniref:Uncharacterized protein n=1 Tax=Sinisalibacter aestuarii TaxID=2949426 RepID=A0ABQ5LU55_9RHOB|nr:hypothetical protein [Sinisalibacter aestuarii]GKY87955.1 hypothetical protein STA1M1_18240 [Sinisalibacter aestuarii]